MEVDRIDNNKGYYKENCRWATPKEQNNNKRNNRVIDYDGKQQTLSQWAEELGICRTTIYYRQKRGGVSVQDFFDSLKN